MKSIIYSLIAIMMATMVYSAIPAIKQQEYKATSQQFASILVVQNNQAFYPDKIENTDESFGFYETFNRKEILGILDKSDALFLLLTIPNEDEQIEHGLADAVLGYCSENQKVKVDDYLSSSIHAESIHSDLRFAWNSKPDKEGNWHLYLLKKNAQLSRNDVLEAASEYDKTTGTANVCITFNEKSALSWQEITRNNIGQSIAVVFNQKVYFAPVVRDEIRGGKCIITGNFTSKEANYLVSIIED